MTTRSAVAAGLLLVFGPPGRPTEPPEPASGRAICSLRPFAHFRTTNHIYFIGTATRDTVPATAGTVRTDRTIGGGHFGPGQPRPIYGQVVLPERIGKPWSALIPANSRQVILVPWDYAADCKTVHWSRTAAWIKPGLRSLLHGAIRDSSHWVDGVPTLDVFAPEQVPFPVADSGSDRNTWPRVPPRNRLTIDEALSLFEILPDRESMSTSPEEVVRPLVDWATNHPDLVDKWPAVDALRWHRIGVEDQLVRLRPSSIAGTYRFTITRPGIDTVTVYARTEPIP